MTSRPAVNRRWQSCSAYFLAFTIWIAVLVMFLSGRWITPNLFQAGLFLLATLWGVAILWRPFALEWSFVLIPLAGTVAWGLMQLLTGRTVGRWETWMAVLTWMGNLAAFFLAMQVCAAERVRRRFLDLLLYFAFVLSVVSVVQYFSSNGKIFWFYPTYDPAVLGPFVSRDRYAAFMEMLLPPAIVHMLAGQRPLRFAVMGAAMYASVIAGASRAGTLLMTAELIVVPGLAWMRSYFSRGKMRMTTTGIWLLVFIFTAVVGWTVLWNRLQDPDPLKGRREILAASLTMVRAKPYFGFGLGNYQNAYPKFATVDFGRIVNHAHNDWMEWAADGGIPFSLLVLCIAAWSVPKAVKSLWGIGVLTVFVHSMVDFPLQDPVLEVWLFVLLGVLAAENPAQHKSRGSGING